MLSSPVIIPTKGNTLAQRPKCELFIDSTKLTALNECIRFFQDGSHGVHDRAGP